MVTGCDIEDNTNYKISGTVTVYGTEAALDNLTIKLTGAATDSTTTDSSGNFNFTSQSNGTYTVIPSSTVYTFDPVSSVVVIN